MSVYERNRSVSELEFYATTIELRIEVNRLMASSSVVPKSYRLLNAVPTVETARSVVYNVTRGYSFYPSNSFNVLERRRYYTLAIADCEQLCLDFQCLIELGLAVAASRFERVVELCDKEIALLKGARKNTRLLGEKTTDERIAEAQAELERLHAL